MSTCLPVPLFIYTINPSKVLIHSRAMLSVTWFSIHAVPDSHGPNFNVLVNGALFIETHLTKDTLSDCHKSTNVAILLQHNRSQYRVLKNYVLISIIVRAMNMYKVKYT